MRKVCQKNHQKRFSKSLEIFGNYFSNFIFFLYASFSKTQGNIAYTISFMTRHLYRCDTQTHPAYSFTVVTTTLHINAYTVKTSYQFDFERFLSATYC